MALMWVQMLPWRLAVRALELFSEAVLLSLLLVSGAFGSGPISDLPFIFMGVTVVFMWGYGYVFTTFVFGAIFRSRRRWLYPIVATTLFVVHASVYATGWPWSRRLAIDVLGGCIVFGCTYGGNHLLRRWGPSAAGGSVSERV